MHSRPSVKHVLGVLEWFCMLSEKNIFFLQKTIRNTVFFSSAPFPNSLCVFSATHSIYMCISHWWCASQFRMRDDHLLWLEDEGKQTNMQIILKIQLMMAMMMILRHCFTLRALCQMQISFWEAEAIFWRRNGKMCDKNDTRDPIYSNTKPPKPIRTETIISLLHALNTSLSFKY